MDFEQLAGYLQQADAGGDRLAGEVGLIDEVGGIETDVVGRQLIVGAAALDGVEAVF